MAIITYPLNGVTYDASDAETYFSTRKSGVYSSDDHFGVTISGNHQLTVAPGLAWVQNDDFKGKSIAVTEEVAVDFDIAETALARIDLLVLRFDATENRSYFAVKKGSPAASPLRPEVTRNASVYELGLYAVSMPASAAAITEADITSLLLDETYCGVMRDGVTGIPTAQIQEQAMGIMAGLIDSLSAELGTIVGATVTTDAGSGDPYCNIVFSGDTEKTVLFEFHNLKGKPGENGVSVTHTWDGDVLTFTSASGTTSIDFLNFLKNLKLRRELVRYTTSGTFTPSQYPSDGNLYDFVLVGGGGGGRKATTATGAAGGGGTTIVSPIDLSDSLNVAHPIVVGAGGAKSSSSNAGGTGGTSSVTIQRSGAAYEGYTYTATGGAGCPKASTSVPTGGIGGDGTFPGNSGETEKTTNRAVRGGDSTMGAGGTETGNMPGIGGGACFALENASNVIISGAHTNGGDGIVIVYGY